MCNLEEVRDTTAALFGSLSIGARRPLLQLRQIRERFSGLSRVGWRSNMGEHRCGSEMQSITRSVRIAHIGGKGLHWNARLHRQAWRIRVQIECKTLALNFASGGSSRQNSASCVRRRQRWRSESHQSSPGGISDGVTSGMRLSLWYAVGCLLLVLHARLAAASQ